MRPNGARPKTVTSTSRPPTAGRDTTRSSWSGALTSRPPSARSRGWISSISRCSRTVTVSPVSSTSIQRRSPASPHGSTTAVSSSCPRQDFTGKRRSSVRESGAGSVTAPSSQVTGSETDPYGRRVGFLQPNLPDLDLATWQRGSRQDRMRPLVRHFCEVGFGSPDVVTLVYVVKIALYVLVGWLLVLSTPGIDGFSAVHGLVARPDRVLQVRRLDDAVRGARARLRLRPAQPAVHARRSARSSTGCGRGTIRLRTVAATGCR